MIDEISRELLYNPGLLCHNSEAVEIFKKAGAIIEPEARNVRIRITESILDQALQSAPSKIVLGARNPDNRLILDAHEPRVRFGTGAETNVWLDVEFDGGVPRFTRREGSATSISATEKSPSATRT